MERVHDSVVAEIANGTLLPGQRLRSVRVMAAHHGVSRDTVLRAYDKLIAGGQVYAVRGSGYYVRPAAPADDVSTAPAVLPPLDPQRLIHSEQALDHTPGRGILRHEESATTEIARVIRTVVTGHASYGTYGDPLGYLPLRQALREKLMVEGYETPIEQIVTTPGAIAGLTLVIRALLRPGSWALVEDPCSFMHVRVLMAQGANIENVPRLADGPDLEALRDSCERFRPRVFLLSSILHNPTGSSISTSKLRALIDLAAEFEMLLIDDASYADLSSPAAGRGAVPLLLLGGTRHVIHVGGFSHLLAPAVAPGFVVADEKRMQFIRHYRPAQQLGNAIIQERLLYHFLREGLYRRRCERVRAHLARCSSAVAEMGVRGRAGVAGYVGRGPVPVELSG